MKKKLLLPIVAIIATLATIIGASAFKGKSATADVIKQEAPTAIRWYFNGAPGQENDPSKYQTNPVPGRVCGGGGALCSIMDEPDEGNEDQPGLTHGVVSTGNTAYSPQQLK
ncbi:MAG: hypothetical protein E6Q24_05590 [Chitinophagaceae bacterium]|nr:MAG: hypothetical protein E6Q24_05590 [Chitinophagaceae bacterium]